MYWLIAREAPPDAPYWPGRRLLGCLDAAGWPLLWAILATQAPVSVGVVGPLVVALALMSAIARLNRALTANHRYQFTTWRWGRIVAGLLVIGAVMKLTLRA